MTVGEQRGGFPKVYREAVTTAGIDHHIRFITKYLKIRVSDFPCRIFFSQEDFDGDTNYIEVPVAAAATPNGEWEGPVEINRIWLKGIGGSSNIELVVFQRRG
jgi:hypothetical protein